MSMISPVRINMEIGTSSFAPSARERARKKLVRLIFLFYWMLIFEGALRKWIFPEYHQYILFVRDPIVLLIYWRALSKGFFKRDFFLISGALISLLFLPLMFYQSVALDMNALTLIYGWRMYFFYIPLAFVIGRTFLFEDIARLFRLTLYIAVPLAVLVFVQFISPRGSFINAGYGDVNSVFVVSGTIVRTTGTFTFTAGQTMFAASLIAMLLIAWIYRKRLGAMSVVGLLITTVGGMSHLLLSGSRTAFFMAGLIVIATIAGLFFTRGANNKARGFGSLVVLFFLAFIMFLGPLQDSFLAITARFDNAARSEGSPFMRAIAPLVLFLGHLGTTPPFGYGVGYGTGGGSFFAGGSASLTLAEDEWSRIIMESGPAYGMLYIFYRILFGLSLFFSAIKVARNRNDLIPMILLGFIAYYLVAGQITHTASIQGYCWFFVGLIIASMRQEESGIGAR